MREHLQYIGVGGGALASLVAYSLGLAHAIATRHWWVVAGLVAPVFVPVVYVLGMAIAEICDSDSCA